MRGFSVAWVGLLLVALAPSGAAHPDAVVCYDTDFVWGATCAAWMPVACAALEGTYAYDSETGEHVCVLPEDGHDRGG